MYRLKPCPFCGGEAKLMEARTKDRISTYSVICQNCGVGIFRATTAKDKTWKGYADAEEAAEDWNRRL